MSRKIWIRLILICLLIIIFYGMIFNLISYSKEGELDLDGNYMVIAVKDVDYELRHYFNPYDHRDWLVKIDKEDVDIIVYISSQRAKVEFEVDDEMLSIFFEYDQYRYPDEVDKYQTIDLQKNQNYGISILRRIIQLM